MSRKAVEKDYRSRAMFSYESKTLEDGLICTFSATHYLVDGTLGAEAAVMIAKRFSFDT